MRLHRTNEWGLIISSVDGTRPASAMGAAITPVQNATNGAYQTLLAGASVTSDVYAIEICVNNVGISAAARDCLATLGFDPAGGTSFTDFVDLLCGSAAPYASLGNTTGIGHHYRFPLWIKAGTTIGMRASVNSADVTAINAFVRVYCKPSAPELIWCGQKIEQLGVTTASSTGTAVTPGTTSEGSWTSIGTTTRNHRFYEFGFGANDAAQSANVVHVDVSVGDASNKKVIVIDHPVMTLTSEYTNKPACPTPANSKSGDVVYVRMQVGPGAADTVSAAVYAMGD